MAVNTHPSGQFVMCKNYNYSCKLQAYREFVLPCCYDEKVRLTRDELLRLNP